jgi:hypothetical protein
LDWFPFNLGLSLRSDLLRVSSCMVSISGAYELEPTDKIYTLISYSPRDVVVFLSLRETLPILVPYYVQTYIAI